MFLLCWWSLIDIDFSVFSWADIGSRSTMDDVYICCDNFLQDFGLESCERHSFYVAVFISNVPGSDTWCLEYLLTNFSKFMIGETVSWEFVFREAFHVFIKFVLGETFPVYLRDLLMLLFPARRFYCPLKHHLTMEKISTVYSGFLVHNNLKGYLAYSRLQDCGFLKWILWIWLVVHSCSSIAAYDVHGHGNLLDQERP